VIYILQGVHMNVWESVKQFRLYCRHLDLIHTFFVDLINVIWI